MYPTADEIRDGVDNDCDSDIDIDDSDFDPAEIVNYLDSDDDGYGDSSTTTPM